MTLTATTGGTVAKNPDQATYDENAVVTITATPETGYEFVKWSDEVTDATRTITMDQNYELEAIFATTATPQYTLTLTATTGGTVAKTPDLVIYDKNAVVTIKATPDTDYEFVKWSDGNTNATRIITMDQNYVLEAIFAEKTVVKYTLNLTAGTGGTVTKDPDQANYEEGVVVTIKAVPDVDFEFVTWSDGNTDAQRTITMDKNYNLQAEFRSTLIPTDYYTMTLTSGVGGSVSKDPDQAYYAKDEVVTIKASAEPGYVFDQWSDGSKDGARLIVMDRHYNLHATFKFAESDHDIKDLNVTGSSLRLTAKWTSTATRFEILITDSKDQEVKKEKVDITDDVKVYRYTASKNGTYTVKVTPIDNSNQPVGNGASKSVTLTKTYSLNIYTEGGGTVNEEVNGSYAYGEKVEIIATPNNGYTFKMWSDENTSAKRTLTMDQNYDLMAIFARIPTYTLDIYEGEYGKASMEVGSYTYQKDEQVTLTPIPNEGYKFSHWNVNGEENTSTELVLTMNQDYYVYPVCVEIPVPTYTLTILPNEHGKANMEVGTYTYKEGETVTLLPIANEDYLFSQWLVNGEAKTDSALVIVMDKDYEITPTFVPNQVGVENIYDGITFRVERNTIIVEATHHIDVALYDLTGHLVDQQSHTRMASFNVPCAGLYLVRTNNGIKKIHVE